jgi:hypothetical protein
MQTPAERQPVITGMGMVTPWGTGREAFAGGVAAGRPALAELTLFEPPGRCELAAEVGEYDYAPFLFSTQPYLDRTTALAAGAAREALDAAGLDLPVPEDASAPVGLALGTAWGCMESMDRFAQPLRAGKPKLAQGLVFSHSFPNSPASVLSIEYGLRGYASVHAGSRLAGFWALASAAEAILSGRSEAVLVGAADSLSLPVLAHKDAAGLLTHGPSPEPFNPQSSGTVPAEGACFLVLESAAHAHSRQAPVLGLWQSGWEGAGLSNLPEWVLSPNTPRRRYACAPGIPSLDAFERTLLGGDTDGVRTLTPLHGDMESVNPLLVIAAALLDESIANEEEVTIVQAGTEGYAAARFQKGGLGHSGESPEIFLFKQA